MNCVLLLGAGGLLGRAFSEGLHGRCVVPAGRAELGDDPAAALNRLFLDHKPDLVINCAAHTDLEAAEKNSVLDYSVNAELPGLIGANCKAVGARLLHFSSVGCYGSWKSSPYCEDDILRPTSAHHKAKVAGEEAVKKSGCRFILLRTGWLFGGAAGQPKNFVWNRIVEARNRTELTCDAVQRGCPTYVDDVVRQALLVLDSNIEGTFNAVAQGTASRCEYIGEIVTAAGLYCSVRPRPRFERVAKVSMNEMAHNKRLKELGLDIMPDWRDSLRWYISSKMPAAH